MDVDELVLEQVGGDLSALGAEGIDAQREQADGRPMPYGLTPSNLVVIAKLGVEIGMHMLSEVLYGTAATFPAAICRASVPTCTPMVFETGRMEVLGNRHIDDTLLSAYLIMEQLREIGITPSPHAFRLCNVVCSASLGHYLQLDHVFRDYPTRCLYSEVFEGLHFAYRRAVYDGERKVTMIIMFESGRLVVTGGTSQESIRDSLKHMIPILRHYQTDEKPVNAMKELWQKRRKKNTRKRKALIKHHKDAPQSEWDKLPELVASGSHSEPLPPKPRKRKAGGAVPVQPPKKPRAESTVPKRPVPRARRPRPLVGYTHVVRPKTK